MNPLIQIVKLNKNVVLHRLIISIALLFQLIVLTMLHKVSVIIMIKLVIMEQILVFLTQREFTSNINASKVKKILMKREVLVY